MDQLSDDLLVLILSKLTMKEAVRTSVLSHRWEKLWVYYAGSLNFYCKDAKPASHQLSVERPRLMRCVNHVLHMHQGSTIDEFRVCIELDESHRDDIERWIKFAVEKTVSKLELDFSMFSGYYVKQNRFWFPSKLLDSPNNLLPPFVSLTSLRFNCVNLSDKDLAFFVSNCPLEHLSIKRASCLTYLDATAALKLKYLEIESCHPMKNVDISNTNIESLKFNGAGKWETRSPLKKLHLLREVSFGNEWYSRAVWSRFRDLPIHQLQRLELDLGFSILMDQIKFAEVFPTFCNLKHLKVSLVVRHDQNIFCLTSLICASPCLESFTLKIRYDDEMRLLKVLFELPNCEWRKSENRIHKCLKVVEFIGFYGYNSELDLVYYLIEKSVVLEKVIIDPKVHVVGKLAVIAEEMEKVSRDRAKLLEKYVPPGMEFVIL